MENKAYWSCSMFQKSKHAQVKLSFKDNFEKGVSLRLISKSVSFGKEKWTKSLEPSLYLGQKMLGKFLMWQSHRLKRKFIVKVSKN